MAHSVSAAEITQAAARIRPHVRRTPVLTVAGPDFGLHHPLALKLELFQHTGSFKTRGAFNALLSGEVPAAGVVAASGGNHGAAVAFAASKLGYRARIYVPRMAGASKIGLIRDAGADLVVTEGAYADAFAASEEYRAETGAMSIHAYDAPATLAGQGTIGQEIEAQVPDLDVLLVAVGGGGLIGGIAAWYENRVKVVAVEPLRAAALNAALQHGPDTEVEVGGVAANSLGARRIGQLCYEVAIAQDLESVLVSDEAITSAQQALWSQGRILAEPGGACALAALTSGAYRPPEGARVGVVVCGGNIDPSPIGATVS